MRAGELIEIEVESLNYSARSVGRSKGFVVFVNGGVPGDKLVARITQVKKSYAIADIVRIVNTSPHRQEPACKHFIEGCGGCQWQHIDYEYQLIWKKEIIRQALQRIGGLEELPEIDVRHAGDSFSYRNKLRLFRVEDGRGLGMRVAGTHRVVPISACLISSRSINTVLANIAFSSNDWFDELTIRSSHTNGDTMVIYAGPNKSTSALEDIEKLKSISHLSSISRRIASGRRSGSR